MTLTEKGKIQMIIITDKTLVKTHYSFVKKKCSETRNRRIFPQSRKGFRENPRTSFLPDGD